MTSSFGSFAWTVVWSHARSTAKLFNQRGRRVFALWVKYVVCTV